MLTKMIAAAAALAILCSTVAMADSGVRPTPCGYQQINVTSLSSLAIPAACKSSATMAVITAEAQAVRYRDDGVAPTTTVGMPLAVGAQIQYLGTISALQFIAQTSGGIVNVLYYR
jgi:hypothetical protein